MVAFSRPSLSVSLCVRQLDPLSMKKAEYFKRAATDAAFRKAQIVKQRDINSYGKVLFWLIGALMIVSLLYCAFTGQLASAISEVLFTAVFCTWLYDSGKTTLAALEAMDDSNPSPASEEIHAASPQRQPDGVHTK